jgi:2-polyprenyl-6-methoxyphenol hydroxylase-like FAD-dependent oxidoreductase
MHGLSAALVVGADGVNSRIRRLATIDFSERAQLNMRMAR